MKALQVALAIMTYIFVVVIFWLTLNMERDVREIKTAISEIKIELMEKCVK